MGGRDRQAEVGPLATWGKSLTGRHAEHPDSPTRPQAAFFLCQIGREANMRPERATGIASMALGVGIATNAGLDPLVLGVIRLRESANIETQLLGGELTSLFLAAPMAIIAGVLWWRGSRLAPAVGIGPAGFAMYTYIQFVLVPDYSRYDGNNERFFPLYLALVMLGGWLVWRSMAPALGRTYRQPDVQGRRCVWRTSHHRERSLRHRVDREHFVGHDRRTDDRASREHATGFWLVRLMDLGFIVPFGITTGVGLLCRAPWASRNAYAFAGTQSLLACAVSWGMALLMSGSDTIRCRQPGHAHGIDHWCRCVHAAPILVLIRTVARSHRVAAPTSRLLATGIVDRSRWSALR